MPKKIRFIPAEQMVADKLPPPAAARTVVPEWYKQAHRFIGGRMRITEGGVNKDLKLCVPFLDALTAGYTIELPSDLVVKRDEQGVQFFWHEEPDTMTVRAKDMATSLPRPAGHDHDLYAWRTYWGIQTPLGYSALFVHPLNRFDLPFITTSGIMDTDHYSNPGEIPFFLKKGFEGVIPAGTPIIQVIPLKREPWVSEAAEYDAKFIERAKYLVSRILHGGYKKLHWQKKDYS
jgi:hypothetical protein